MQNIIGSFILFFIVGQAFAETKKVCNPTVQATVSVQKEVNDDGKLLVARVTLKEKPLQNITINFQTPRLFGLLSHGTAVTDQNGLAKLSYPENFPGDAKTGTFTVQAKIVNSETYFGEGSVQTDEGTKLKIIEDPFPREIWSTNTDLHLLLTIPFLILCVWSVYIFSILQLFRIARMKKT